MPTPTSPETRLHASGFKKHTVWGTAVALGATDEVAVEGSTGLHAPTYPIIGSKESDQPFIKQGDFGNQDPIDFTVPIKMRYELGSIGRAIAMIFGTAGAPAQQESTDAYLHTLQWKDEISGLFGTWVEERAGKIFEVPSAKPYKLELSFSDALLKGAISFRGNTCIDNSSVNTATQIDALTLPAGFLETGARFKQGFVKMNAESDGDVSVETSLQVNDLSIRYERPIDAGVHAVGDEKIVEPFEEGHSGHDLIAVSLKFPRMNSTNAAFFQTFTAETTQKALIQFDGAVISGAYKYDFAFYFPRLRMKQVTNDVDEIVSGGLELIAEEAASAPTGMTWTRPAMIVINKQTTDYLA